MIELAGDVSLARWNTFGVESRADFATTVRSVAALEEVMAGCAARGLALTVLGGGSNVILLDRLPGCVVRIDIPGVEVRRSGHDARVTAGAGVVWHDLVRFCIGQGLFGIENLALIPGRVGAAPIQNIGAYGAELADCFESLTAISLGDGALVRHDREACGFGYRDSVFKQRSDLIITSVTLALSSRWIENARYPDLAEMLGRLGGPRTPARLAEAVIRVRRAKLPNPRRHGNAGSVFKNPTVSASDFDRLRGSVPGLAGFETPAGIKIPAARLIESCGWKGRRQGPVGVWHRQPLVLVNRGGARGADVLALAGRIRDDVASRFGVALELEPQVLGRDRGP